MTTFDALAFLHAHQPLPNDDDLGEQPDLMLAYDDVRKYFIAHPDPRCVPLFLNSFGGWDGFGMYQLVEDVFDQMDEDVVMQSLLTNLQDVARLSPCILYWNVQLCMTFPHPSLLPALVQMLNHPLADIRIMTTYALGQLEAERVVPVLQRQLAVEDDGDVADALRKVLEEL